MQEPVCLLALPLVFGDPFRCNVAQRSPTAEGPQQLAGINIMVVAGLAAHLNYREVERLSVAAAAACPPEVRCTRKYPRHQSTGHGKMKRD